MIIMLNNMNFKKYSSYKESGIEWIGDVPKQWNIKRLKYLDKTIMGQSPESNDCNKDGVGIPFLQGNADFSGLNPNPSVWCEAPNKLATKDDILLSVRAPVGAVNIADQTYGIGRGLCAIRPKQSQKKYSYYRALCLSGELNRIATGSTYTAISVDEVNNVAIPDPVFDEQELLSSFLDFKTAQIDGLIAKKERMIELLREERIAIINQAVAGQIDVVGANGRSPLQKNAVLLNRYPEYKDSGIEWLGKMPKHWEVKKLKYVADKVQTGITPPSGNASYYDGGNINWYTPGDFKEPIQLKNSFRKINRLAIEEGVARMFPSHSVLLIGIGATLGKVGIIESPSSSNQQINAIIFSDKFNPFFGVYYLQAIANTVISLSNASTLAILNQTQTKDILVLVPPLEEQDKIVKYIQSVELKHSEIVNKEQKQIDLLKEYRTVLISEVVTGKIDVRG